jgi:hypothetical protein
MLVKESVLLCLIVCFLYGATPVALMAESGRVIQKVLAKGQRDLRPFAVKDNWEILWDFKGPSLSITLYSADGTMLDVVATHKGRGSGSSHQVKGGEYYLQVMGTGDGRSRWSSYPNAHSTNVLVLLLLCLMALPLCLLRVSHLKSSPHVLGPANI